MSVDTYMINEALSFSTLSSTMLHFITEKIVSHLLFHKIKVFFTFFVFLIIIQKA